MAPDPKSPPQPLTRREAGQQLQRFCDTPQHFPINRFIREVLWDWGPETLSEGEPVRRQPLDQAVSSLKTLNPAILSRT